MEPFSTASAFIVTNIFILLFTLLSAPNRYFSTGMSPKTHAVVLFDLDFLVE